MSHWFTFLAVIALLMLASVAWRRLHVYAMLRRLRIAYPACREISPEQMAAEIALLLDEAARPLLALGFVPVGSQECLPAISSSAKTLHYSRHYLHQETGTFAHLLPQDAPDSGTLAVTIFETRLRDGRVISTVNRRRHLLLPLPASYLLEDGYLDSVEAQWALHRQRSTAIEGERLTDYAEVVQQNEALGREIVDGWRSSGLVQRVDDHTWQLSVRGAIRHMRTLFTAAKRTSALAPFAEEVSLEARVTADLRAYQSYEQQLEAGWLGRGGKTLLFALSAALGAVAFGLVFSWQIVPILLGVLLFHEFGHALAMRATGYRNVQVLVIPLLGAVASGRNDEATPWAKLLVLLAGPLPGLLIAVVILHGIADNPADYPLLLQIGLMALVINIFNLLPLTPLDGGQIVETFLFSRWPRLRLPFFIASALAIAALAIWLDSLALFGFAVFLLLISRRLSVTFRLARQIGAVEKEQAPRAILTAFHEREANTLRSFAQRLHALRSVLPLVLARPLHLRESLFGTAIYLAAIALPLFSLSEVPAARQMYDHFFGTEQPVVETERNWDMELATATTMEGRWQILNEAADWEENENYEPEAAQRRYQQALEVAQGFPPGDIRLLDTRIALARTTEDEAEALTRYRELLEATAALKGKERLRYAEVLEALYPLDNEAPIIQRIGYLRTAVTIRETVEQPASYQLGNDYEEIARALYRLNQPERAESELRMALAANNTAQQAMPLIWLLLDQGKAVQAEALTREYQKGIKKALWLEIQLADALAWALSLQGKGAQGYEQLTRAVEMTEPGSGWHRYYLMLELIKFSGNDLVRRTHWRAQVKRELIEEGIGARRLAEGMRYYGSYSPWDAQRHKARLESLTLLGLTQEEPARSCR